MYSTSYRHSPSTGPREQWPIIIVDNRTKTRSATSFRLQSSTRPPTTSYYPTTTMLSSSADRANQYRRQSHEQQSYSSEDGPPSHSNYASLRVPSFRCDHGDDAARHGGGVPSPRKRNGDDASVVSHSSSLDLGGSDAHSLDLTFLSRRHLLNSPQHHSARTDHNNTSSTSLYSTGIRSPRAYPSRHRQEYDDYSHNSESFERMHGGYHHHHHHQDQNQISPLHSPPPPRHTVSSLLAPLPRITPTVQPTFRPQHSRPTTTKHIQVAPGEFLPLRGAQETWAAVMDDFYVPCSCLTCTSSTCGDNNDHHHHETIFVIGDASYVLCPMCQSVSPVAEEACSNSVAGVSMQHRSVGLGFTLAHLAKWQEELRRRRRQQQS